MNQVLRIAIPLILLALIIGGVVFGLRHHETERVACSLQIPQPRIVAFGDSLVAGYGATLPGGFVTLISQQLKLPILNLGKNGDTTASAKERITSVTAATPTITILLLGGNDALQQIPVADTEQNLGDIIQELQKNGSKVILLGVIGGIPDPYSAMYKRIAETYDVPFVSNVLSGIIGHSDLMSDGVHPNQTGYQKIADRVLPVLEKECEK